MGIRNRYTTEPTYTALFQGWTHSIRDDSHDKGPLEQLGIMSDINPPTLSSYHPDQQGRGSPLYRLTKDNASALTMAEIMDILIIKANDPEARLGGRLSLTTANVTFEHPNGTRLHLDNQEDIHKFMRNYRYIAGCHVPIPDDYFKTHSGVYIPPYIKGQQTSNYSLLGSNLEHPTGTGLQTESTQSILDSPIHIALAGGSKEKLDDFCLALTKLTEAPPHRIFWSKPFYSNRELIPVGSFWKLDIRRYVEKDRKQPDYWAQISLSQCRPSDNDEQRFIARKQTNKA